MLNYRYRINYGTSIDNHYQTSDHEDAHQIWCKQNNKQNKDIIANFNIISNIK